MTGPQPRDQSLSVKFEHRDFEVMAPVTEMKIDRNRQFPVYYHYTPAICLQWP